MLEDIDLICEILRILMEACTDNGKANSFHGDGGTKLNEPAYQKD